MFYVGKFIISTSSIAILATSLSLGCSNVCGDNLTLGAEVCDDGNLVDGDGCDSNCTFTACGNGIVTADEECDDGNLVDGDDCDSNCTTTACGNGIVTADEECDDGNLVNGDGCSVVCRVGFCGDGVVDLGEECDDANVNEIDDCNIFCRVVRHQPVDVAIVDMDNDGDSDIISAVFDATNFQTSYLEIQYNNGTGTMTDIQILDGQLLPGIPSDFSSLVIEDINRDGLHDILTTRPNANQVVIWIQDQSQLEKLPNFTPQVIQLSDSIGLQPSDLAVGFFDGDNIFDIVTANANSNNITFFNSTNGASILDPFPVGFKPTALAVVDLEGNNTNDIIVANLVADLLGGFAITLYKGEVESLIFTRQDISVLGAPFAVATGSFNSDSLVDIVTINKNSTPSDPKGSLSLLRANGNTDTFVETTLLLDGKGFEVLVTDTNNDGRDDILAAIVADSADSAGHVSVFLQGTNPSANFSDQNIPSFPVGVGPTAMASGDLDEDGNIDIVVANFEGESLSILFGNGDGTFVSK